MTIQIVRPAGLCTVQDLGRRGHMHEAVPPGGALVPELLVAANRRVRNSDDAPAIEVLGRLVVRATRDIEVATDRDGPRILRGGESGGDERGESGGDQRGDELVVESEPRRVSYLAVRGGFDVPRMLDGRGTLLCAGLGKALARGDVLQVGDEIERRSPDPEPFVDSEYVTVIAGPDFDAFAPDALDQLERATFRISPTTNRVGTRLELAPRENASRESAASAVTRVAAYRERSRPMVLGALEVPGDGIPIVLGPEHPTTGGYPILAVIASAELGRFFAIRLGGTVRFRVAR